MNWKLPEALQKSISYFKPGSKDKDIQSPSMVNEDEDHLGIIKYAERHSPCPFRRVENSFHSYVEIALPVELERLQQHQINIKKWRRLTNYAELQSEYRKAAITVEQIKAIISNVESLRLKIVESDHLIFDKRLAPVKGRAMTAIERFVAICGDTEDGLFHRMHHEVPSSSINTGKGDLEPVQQESSNGANSITMTHDVRGVHMKGNRLLIDSDNPSQFYPGLDVFQYSNVQDFVSENETPIGLVCDEQLDLVVEKEDIQFDEDWKRLEKDMTELHEMMKDFSAVVHDQGATVDSISDNVGKAEQNIKEGNKQLSRATILKAAMFPVLGAVVGGAVGGPIGMFAGLKLGSMTTGFAAVGVTGTVLGYQGGKVLKKRQEENSIEMKELRKREESESSDSFEFLENEKN